MKRHNFATTAGRRILKRLGLQSGSGQRTCYFFNGLTEEVSKVSVDGVANMSWYLPF